MTRGSCWLFGYLTVWSLAVWGDCPVARVTCHGALPQDRAGIVDGGIQGQFGSSLWVFEFQIDDAEFAAMEPPPPQGFGGPAASASGTTLNNSDRPYESNLFGTRFPWVNGNVVWRSGPGSDNSGAKILPGRWRYDGDFTYLMSGMSPKRPLFFEVSGDETIDGAKRFRLHTMQFDPTMLRERTAVHLFAGLQVPIPRVIHAEVRFKIGEREPHYLGLYTLLEAVDENLLQRHGIPAESVRLQINGLQSIQYLGDEWSLYAPFFRSVGPVNRTEQRRIIEFAKFVSQSDEAEFTRRIGEFINVDATLRYFAAITLCSNITGFSNIGVNDFICISPGEQPFSFVANELETTLGNAALSGTPEQLADLSILHPYAGSCLLMERLLKNESYKSRYFELLETVLDTNFGPSLDEKIQQLENTMRDAITRESEVIAQRQRQAGGGGFPGAPGASPDRSRLALETVAFVQARRESIRRQLAGAEGYVPSPPNMGGFGRRQGAAAAISDLEFRDSVKVPQEFEATLFAKSPDVNYPVAIAAEPTGAIYVAIDEQGSLGTTPGGGRVVRCVDSNGDGVMDRFTVFCRVDHVRGVVYRGGEVWVSHPPFLSKFRDLDGDGVADQHEQLVRGLTTEMVDTRGGDHTTNGVRLGIDGWLYIGDGDYGVPDARGVDGSSVVLRGGGILRVRPDGTELELFASGLRNPFDIAIDPLLNMFTRDNTNDGGGWDTRVSQLHQSAEYGYPQLFANFSDEIMPTLGSFGGGGGTSALYIEDDSWPAHFNRSLFTGDWGRSGVFHHPLVAAGPTFRLTQESFLEVPRATGMDLDADGNLYVASWWSGEASVYVGPHVGFIACVHPKNRKPRQFPALSELTSENLVAHLRSEQAVVRFHVQGELLARGNGAENIAALTTAVQDSSFPLSGRVAALFALKQLLGEASHSVIIGLLEDASLREFSIRALTDRKTQMTGLTPELFLPYLSDPDLRVVAQTVVSLGRLGDPAAARWLLPLAMSGIDQRPDPNAATPERVIPHLAVQSLVSLGATEVYLAALDSEYWPAALRVLRNMHSSTAVRGLIARVGEEKDPQRRFGILTTLIRLYYKETPYDGSWWGIRPDTTGPYYDPIQWEESVIIEMTLRESLVAASDEDRGRLLSELGRHQILWEGLSEAVDLVETNDTPIVIPEADPNNPSHLGNMGYTEALRQTLAIQGDQQQGLELYRTRSCAACHTSAAGQKPVGPHLADIGKRYNAEELIESILKPSEKIAQGYETQIILLESGEVLTGFVVSETGRQIWLRDGKGTTHRIVRDQIEERNRQATSSMPAGLLGSATPTDLADLIAYLQSL